MFTPYLHLSIFFFFLLLCSLVKFKEVPYSLLMLNACWILKFTFRVSLSIWQAFDNTFLSWSNQLVILVRSPSVVKLLNLLHEAKSQPLSFSFFINYLTLNIAACRKAGLKTKFLILQEDFVTLCLCISSST
jgi:hypothetical protein